MSFNQTCSGYTVSVAISCECDWTVSETFLEMGRPSTGLCLNYIHQTLKESFVRCPVSCGGRSLFLTLLSNQRFSCYFGMKMEKKTGENHSNHLQLINQMQEDILLCWLPF